MDKDSSKDCDSDHSSGHSSAAEKISRSSSVALFPTELLSSTKHDAFDMEPSDSARDETGSVEVLSTGSLKMAYVAGAQRAELVDMEGEKQRMLNGVEIVSHADSQSGSCATCRRSCVKCCRPCLYRYNPLPDNPSCLQRIRYACMCPPHGNLAHMMSLALAALLFWAVLWSITGDEALPGGNLFALFILLVLGHVAGLFVEKICRGPALLGMLAVGFCLRNIPKVNIAEDIDPAWSRNLVSIALAVILVRAGCGLDPAALRRLSFAVFRLAFSPCLAETLTVAVASHFILGMPWTWGLMMGFVLGAVSPAVVVPSMLSLSQRRLGTDKGIPTLVIAAASVDDVLAISGFGVLLGITFSTGEIWVTLLRGPVEALMGVVYGVMLGLLFWLLPHQKDAMRLLLQLCLLLGAGLFAVLGSGALEVPGAGALGCLTVAFVAALKYRQQDNKQEDGGKSNEERMDAVLGVLWSLMQPLLFGLIGAEVALENIELSRVGLSVAVLAIGLAVRAVVALLAVTCTALNKKEMIFIVGAWLPKATVQAAIGAVALNTARTQPPSEDYDDNIALGTDILTMAVLSIVITAPLGAILIAVLGPLLLHKQPANPSIDQP